MDGEAPTSAEGLFTSMILQLQTLPADEQEMFRWLLLEWPHFGLNEVNNLIFIAIESASLLRYHMIWVEVLKKRNSRGRVEDNPDRNAQIRDDRENGMSYGRLAHKYHKTIDAIRGVLRRSDPNDKKEEQAKINNEIVYDWDCRMKPDQLAKKYHISEEKIQEVIANNQRNIVQYSIEDILSLLEYNAEDYKLPPSKYLRWKLENGLDKIKEYFLNPDQHS